jgi:hypothetical protein
LKVLDPYNMYYTPDGKFAIVVAERLRRLDFRDAATMKLVESVPVPCRGVDHMDFSIDGRYLIASCEFSGQLVKVDVATRKLLGTLKLPARTRCPGRTDRAGRLSVLRRRHDVERRVRHRRRVVQFGDADPDRQGHARHLSEPRLEMVLRVEPRRRHDLAARSEDAQDRNEVDDSWRRQPDMGGVSSDGKVLWLSGALQRRGLRARHDRRST